nr:hypothetical protein [Tanacetum cinerariifolium]
MSSSTVTYTSISSDSDLPPWGFHLMDPYEFETLKSPEQAQTSPDYVLGPEYLEYLAPSDNQIPIQDQPLPAGDDKEEEDESFDDDDDDAEKEDAFEEDEDEEDEHLALTDSVALPAINPAHIAEYASASIPPSPPPSLLSPLSSPLPKITSPLLLLPPPLTSPTYASEPLGYRAAMVQFEVEESLTAAVARQTGHTLAHKVDYGFIDTLDAKAVYARHTWSRSKDRSTDLEALIRAPEARITALEAQTRALQRDVSVLQRQRIDDGDRMTMHIQHKRDRFRELSHTREARHQDEPVDAEIQPKKTTTPMTDAAIKQLIAQGVVDALTEYEANRNSRNGDDNHKSGSGERRTLPTTREYTYSDFQKCQPLNFKGTEGVVVLTQCALTWWNSHVKTVGHDATYGVPWKTLNKMMTAKYCPRSEIKKLEVLIWNLKVKGSVMASKPKIMQDAIKFANDLMDQKICTFTERQAENKRKLDDNSRNNHTQQQPHKRQNVAKAYTARPGEKREYGGSLPLCTKCNYHYNRQCAPKCNNYKKVGHLARNCRSTAATANNQRSPEAIQRVVTCFECRVQGHYKKDFHKLKNKNRGNCNTPISR